MPKLLSILAASLFSTSLVLAKEPLNKSCLQPQSPLSFIENKGQVTDQDGNARNDIDFKLSVGKGLNVFVGRNGLHYQWSKTGKYSATFERYRMDVELPGANNSAEIIAEEKADYYEQYYTPPFDSKGMKVCSYGKLTYKNIYPDIDWVLYIKNNKLEYDFIVRPGGDVKNIKLKYNGATDLSLIKNDLAIAKTPMGNISEECLICYERDQHNYIASKFSLENNVLGFDVDSYKGTLVIDPVLDWATYYGGEAWGIDLNSIACDSSGNIFGCGQTLNGAGNIATVGAYQSTYLNCSGCPPNYNGVIVKFDSAGQRLWGTYYGSGNTQCMGITCDRNGNIYITGNSNSTNVATAGSYQSTIAGGPDAFLTKFNTNGSII